MLLLAGLGNPGAKYQNNRHNIGFRAIDSIASSYNFSSWSKKFHAEIAQGYIANHSVLLIKPQTFMNLSGQSLAQVIQFYKITPKDITVFHDEMNITEGRIRIKRGGSHGGHNGVFSLNQHIKNEYRRIRIGIGHPGEKELVHSYVLGNFTKEEEVWVNNLLIDIAKHIEILLNEEENLFLTECMKKNS